jgi:hypothetical protein
MILTHMYRFGLSSGRFHVFFGSNRYVGVASDMQWEGQLSIVELLQALMKWLVLKLEAELF